MAKLALITGASSGIGYELAKIHAKNGGDVLLVARRLDRLNALKAELEGAHKVSVDVLAEDLSDEGAAQRIFDHASTLRSPVEFLINNAGFGGRGLFVERDWASDRDMIQVNIIALSALTRLFLPGMISRQSGRILNVSSPAGELPGPMQAVYFASKAFVTSFSLALTEETRGAGVTVTALLPGATASEFAQTADMEKTPLFVNAASPKNVAETGYAAMMAGRMKVFAGIPFSRRIIYAFAPFVPIASLMRSVRKAQETPK
ncbi:MAG: SDR family oxidoreductase [Pseudomonadota bacterium]